MTSPAPDAAALLRAAEETRIAQLLVLTQRITDVLAADIAALEAGRFDSLRTTDDDVARLCAVYGREVAGLKAAGGVADARDPRIAQLRDAAAHLNVLLARHQTLVSAMRQASEGLVQAVAKEVRKVREDAAPYRAVPAARRAETPAIVYNKMV